MRSLGRTLDRLSQTTARLADRNGTDSFFVLRAAATGDGRGGTRKTYAATTTVAYSGFLSLVKTLDRNLQKIAAERRVPVVFRRMFCAASVDCTVRDKLTVVARGATPELTEMEIVRSVIVSGVGREIITVEEQTTEATT
jgi:hypothetical protein